MKRWAEPTEGTHYILSALKVLDMIWCDSQISCDSQIWCDSFLENKFHTNVRVLQLNIKINAKVVEKYNEVILENIFYWTNIFSTLLLSKKKNNLSAILLTSSTTKISHDASEKDSLMLYYSCMYIIILHEDNTKIYIDFCKVRSFCYDFQLPLWLATFRTSSLQMNNNKCVYNSQHSRWKVVL